MVYIFNKVENVFNFVYELYHIKYKSKGIIKSVTKLLLNACFGRFAMSIRKPITKILNKAVMYYILYIDDLMCLRVINSYNYTLA